VASVEMSVETELMESYAGMTAWLYAPIWNHHTREWWPCL